MNVSRRACGCGMSRKVVWKSSGSHGRRSQMGHVSLWHAGQFEVASTSYYGTQLAGLSHDSQMTIGFEPTQDSTIVPRHDASTLQTQQLASRSPFRRRCRMLYLVYICAHNNDPRTTDTTSLE